MNPRMNPYAPGAGTPPPELAGRDLLLENASIALDRVRGGLSAKCLVMIGPSRAHLIKKGMIYSPAHGDTAFTVPLFDEYLRRTMPL